MNSVLWSLRQKSILSDGAYTTASAVQYVVSLTCSARQKSTSQLDALALWVRCIMTHFCTSFLLSCSCQLNLMCAAQCVCVAVANYPQYVYITCYAKIYNISRQICVNARMYISSWYSPWAVLSLKVNVVYVHHSELCSTLELLHQSSWDQFFFLTSMLCLVPENE